MAKRPRKPSRKVRFPAHFAALIARAVKLCEAADIPATDQCGGPLHRWVIQHCTYRPEQEWIIVGVLAMELAERRTKWQSLLTKTAG